MDQDILGMSDEDFAKLAPPSGPPKSEPTPAPEPEPTAPVATKEPEPVATPEPEPTPEPTQEDPEPAAEPSGEGEPKEPVATSPAPPAEPTTPPAAVETKAAEPAATEPEPEDKKKDDDEPADTTDYKAFFQRVMAPFKANGKLIQLQSADEVIQLMQMGANYTKKMQAIQGHKKFLMMLENNGLLDEGKLSFLIDLDKKNPEAIKKLLKDSNIDPVDMDTRGEVKYKSGSHAVTDQEATLATAIDDIKSSPGGTETLQSVQSWDAASKKLLWENPEILAAIHQARENGVYDRISAEIERRKILGQIAPTVPFLHAYKIVGDSLFAQTATTPATSAPAPVAVRTPVTVRPAKTPATKAASNPNVRAAAATRSAPKPVQQPVNVLAMSDEEFLKIATKV